MKWGEITIILVHLGVRASLVAAGGVALVMALYAFVGELGGEESDPAVTGILGIIIGGLAGGVVTLVNSVSLDVLDYLKMRLGPASTDQSGP